MAEHRPARILIVARDKFPTFRVDLVELFLYYIARKMQITWLMRAAPPTPLRDTVSDAWRSQTVRVFGHSEKPLKAALQVFYAHLCALREVIAGRYDVVQCRDVLVVAPIYAIAARLRRVKFAYWMSYPMSEGYILRGNDDMARGRYIKGFTRIVFGKATLALTFLLTFRLAHAIFVQSDLMKVMLTKKGVDGRRILPVPMGINTEKYAASEMSAIIPRAGGAVILYVGAIDSARRMEVPSAGVAMYLRDNPEAKFVVIGSSTEQERERLLIPARSLDVAERYVFLDYMPMVDLFKHIVEADVCLAPCPADTTLLAVATPTKLVEYMYLGAQVVANRHPDQEHIITASGAGVLTDFDPESFRSGIEYALTHPDTPAARAAAVEWIQRERSYETLSRKVIGMYEKVLSGVLK